MLGLEDPWIILAYVLCILSALACVVYGVVNWNKGAENERIEISEEIRWEVDERKVEETL